MNLSYFKMLDFQQIEIHFLKSSSKAIFDIQGRIKVFSNSHPRNWKFAECLILSKCE